MNQAPILILGGSNLYSFVSNTNAWFDPLGLKKKRNKKPRRIIPYDDIMDDVDKWSLVPQLLWNTLILELYMVLGLPYATFAI